MQTTIDGSPSSTSSSSGDPPPSSNGGGGRILIADIDGSDLRRSMHQPCATSSGSTPPHFNNNNNSYLNNNNNNINARYKLMSPAKLPISRSPCLTIPPGLSPTSFLDSPVLLSNFKGEPSPTTGSFFKPQMMHNSPRDSSPFLPAMSNSNALDVGQSSSFEFKPNAGSFSMGGFSFSGTLASSAGVNQQQTRQIMQNQMEPQSQSSDPSIAVKSEVIPSDDLKSTIASSGPGVLQESDSYRSSQMADSSHEAQPIQYEQKGLGSQVLTDRTSEDGYNWRKYGQKLVKGSEFPRSYYKCTHPNCEVKKLFEQSPDGQITEIIYKGTHDHPKPQPNRRLAGSLMPSLEEKSDRFPINGQEGKPLNSYCQTAQNLEPSCSPELSPGGGNDNTEDGGASHLNRTADDLDEDDPFAKRRRMEVGEMDITSVVKPIREPRVVVQTVSEVDILDDGYRWRKYGQKVVRGNPNPRSYYKCTYTGCPVRKHVERASHDPKAVITTYEGKHNHEVPTARNSSHDSASRIGQHENRDPVSLDLGVGIRSTSDIGPGQPNGTQYNSSNLVMLQSAPFSTFPGYINGGMAFYGTRENHSQGHNIGNQPVNHSSNPYQLNMGRVLMGP